MAVVGNNAGCTQIARKEVKILHEDVATVLALTARAGKPVLVNIWLDQTDFRKGSISMYDYCCNRFANQEAWRA